MKNKLKKMAGALLLCGVLAASSVTTFAATANVEGGTWNYGTKISGINQKTVYSNYSHSSKKHKSSCSIGTLSVSSGWVSAGQTSYASATGTWNATTHAYYGISTN
ncbi:MAG: lactococcin 972 family bacteriocin [Clostridiales bacterium]|nr:lactococcin 972 family bacteriocin [Clostridiales bacterium]